MFVQIIYNSKAKYCEKQKGLRKGRYGHKTEK